MSRPPIHGRDHAPGGPDPIPGAATGGGIAVMPFSLEGLAAVSNGVLPWETLDAGSVELVHVRAGTPPTGSGLTVRVNKNGSSIGTCTIAAAGSESSFVPASPGFAAGDVFTVDVTAVGSTVPGGDLVVQLKIG